MATGKPNFQYLPPKQNQKGWFGRNCLWFVPLLVILLGSPLLCCGGLGLGIFGGISSAISMAMAPRDAAIESMMETPEVAEKIGMPIEPKSSSMSVEEYTNNNSNGSCILDFGVSGPNTDAQVYGRMKLSNGAWTPDGIRITCDDGTEFVLPEGANVPERNSLNIDIGGVKINMGNDGVDVEFEDDEKNSDESDESKSNSSENTDSNNDSENSNSETD